MEINSEVNKVFGTEMAKLFAATISEEELKHRAEQVWGELNLVKYDYGTRKAPEIERLIKEQILKRLYEKIEAILNEPISDELLEKKAREMVEMARKAGEEAIIKDLARNMVDNTLSIYGRKENILQEVLAQVHVQSEKERNRCY